MEPRTHAIYSEYPKSQGGRRRGETRRGRVDTRYGRYSLPKLTRGRSNPLIDRQRSVRP